MLLAGDVGGTKTLLGLFESAPDRPTVVEIGEFVTVDYDGLEPMIREFTKARGVETRQIQAASFGVAGAITEQIARMTNVPWRVDGRAVAETLGVERTRLINDLEALGYGVTVLEPDELATLQRGVPIPGGNAAVIAAGTGLGEGLLHNVDGRFVPGASEGGHADFAARTPRELELVAELTRVFGRVSVEAVVSGTGLVNLYQFTHQSFGTGPLAGPTRVCDAVGTVRTAADLPKRITAAAMGRRCAQCVETLDLFVSAYGAEAGNIGLRCVATAGVYVGGGIAPKILPALRAGSFLDAVRAKEPMAHLVATMPVSVILNPDAGLIGAAVHAQQLSLTP
jgi:glucokinase